ncbi:MAG: hypothetical protein K0Q83_3432 [Deltaproteobacteria bacterium]|nr:hypothetical protein [Deltaproteobacteria bacterium]
MKTRSVYLLVLFFVLIPSFQPAEGAAPLHKIIMTSGSASERDGAVYVAPLGLGFRREPGRDCRRGRPGVCCRIY